MHDAGIRFRAIGDLTRFDERLRELIVRAETLTAANDQLDFTVAVNYGGRWDILQATRAMLAADPALAAAPATIDEAAIAPYLAMSYAPEPDLFIRTGGEQRISNFLLWQLAYTELFFTDTLWPDFDTAAMDEAIAWYRSRERRFGRTTEQVLASAKRPALTGDSSQR